MGTKHKGKPGQKPKPETADASEYFAYATGGDPVKLPLLREMTESEVYGIVQHKPAMEKRLAQLAAIELLNLIGPLFGAK